ncbi:DUF1697 domain-containing protein [Sanguibacter sp. 4.1]|uniref:DUF1697 domain-containing protein n=1 Tax=Sanguibacter biliveldensis TaxID=3030830 RepID=A0AAF0Z759_9MICO|nr:DUF1697 domain-containing protein [Sanguibacter sp. 4.1]WPF81358.1 DUF1697 domain-containing protein [Sanguibacter sp. 4.1]
MTLTTAVVLLRGVNVGGHRKVPSAGLRAVGENAGWTRATTILASGNLVVSAPTPGSAAAACTTEAEVGAVVHAGLLDRLGLDVDIIVVSPETLDAVVAHNPFPAEAESAPSKLLVTFYATPPTAEAVAGLDLAPHPEQMAWHAGTSYTVYPEGAGTTRLTPALLRRTLGVDGTARNWTTVLRLRDLAAAG